jgi:hypothetical protein
VNAPEDAVRELEAWLAGQTAWERAGDVRTLGYNGPNVPPSNRWWEVQIPVRRVLAAQD